MERPWLVLLLAGCVLLAGCSLPGNGGPTTDGGSGDGSYPQGWGADGLTNATLAVQAADDAIGEEDFVERRVTVEPQRIGGERKYLIDVLVVRADRENERLLTQRRYYVVGNETARGVLDSGVQSLGNRSPDEVSRVYLNASGGYRYRQLGDLPPKVTELDSGNFATAMDQPLPATYSSAVPILESGTFTDAERTDGSVTYTVENVTARPFESGSGRVTVQSDGLVPEFAIRQSDESGMAAFTYELEPGDATVEPPEWTSNASPSGPNRSGATGSGTSSPGTTTSGTPSPPTTTSTS